MVLSVIERGEKRHQSKPGKKSPAGGRIAKREQKTGYYLIKVGRSEYGVRGTSFNGRIHIKKSGLGTRPPRGAVRIRPPAEKNKNESLVPRNESLLFINTTTLLIFLAAAAGTGIVATGPLLCS